MTSRWTIVLILLLTAALHMPGQTPILGTSTVGADAMTAFVRRHNPDFNAEIATEFIAGGERYGIRGDMAFCQAILETGWFRFSDGTAVRPEHNNFCGLGVTRLGTEGCRFETVAEGVSAMMQHLWAYATTDPIPADEPMLDPRFGLVSRGCAPCWEDLSGRWAANPDYARRIITLYRSLCDYAASTILIEVQIP